MAVVQLYGGGRCDLRRRASSCEIADGGPAPFGGTWVVATSPMARLRGMARRPPDHTVMALPRCSDVHTWTMEHALDIAFIDRWGYVIEVHRSVPPKRRLRNGRAAMAVERFAYGGPWFERGDRIVGPARHLRGFRGVSRKGTLFSEHRITRGAGSNGVRRRGN